MKYLKTIEVKSEADVYLDIDDIKYIIDFLESNGYQVFKLPKNINPKKNIYLFPDFDTREEILNYIKQGLGLKKYHDKERIIKEIEEL